MNAPRLQSLADFIVRYAHAFGAAWQSRHAPETRARTSLERQFLPAALEILETPAPALPRAVMWVIVSAAAFVVLWATFGKIEVIAVAPGKIIAADKTKIIQPAETAIV